jgi:hypothetical protein
MACKFLTRPFGLLAAAAPATLEDADENIHGVLFAALFL